jgi:hypothetical protein
MGLSSRKRTNRRFNGTKMVVNNTGTASTIVPKNDFTQTNQYNQISPDENNFIPCTTGQGLLDSNFNLSVTNPFYYDFCDVNTFYVKNELLVSLVNNDDTVNKILKVNSVTGEIVTSKTFNDAVYNITQYSLNRYLISGKFTEFVDVIDVNLNPITGFGTIFSTNFLPKNIFAVPTIDNKILVVGIAENSPYKLSTDRNYQQVWRLNSNGNNDSTYYSNTTYGIDTNTQFFPASSSVINGIIPLSDGSCVIYGNFTSYRAQSRVSIVQLDSVGNVDNQFSTTLDSGYINEVKILPNGNYLIGGKFFNNNISHDEIYLMEIDTDGNPIDNGISQLFGYEVTSILIDDGSKVIVVMKNYNLPYVRYNTDWTIDNTFNTEITNPSDNKNYINKFRKSQNGGYFIKGNFEGVGNVVKLGFVKLKGC